jgi:imidazole glycerol phosphate synthase glutamine amidotransferase subunit
MIAIFDYGAGNLRSVENTLDAIGAKYEIVNDSAGLLAAEKIILPGVGHFGQMLRSLDALGVRDTLKERIAAGIPFLGICLGLQGLFESSDEAPALAGLGVFPGRVVRFPQTMTVPQMGWNKLQVQGAPSLLEGVGDQAYVYFANSYYVPAETAADRAALPSLNDENMASKTEAGTCSNFSPLSSNMSSSFPLIMVSRYCLLASFQDTACISGTIVIETIALSGSSPSL